MRRSCFHLLLLLVVPLLATSCSPPRPLYYRIDQHYPADSAQFSRTMGNLLGPPLITGNAVTCYENGDQIFPAMLQAIHSARKSITFETFIYWSGNVGHEFAEAFAERARAGVRVHVLLDWLGSLKADPDDLNVMKSAGVEVHEFNVFEFYDPASYARLNHRTHRKLLIVDGTIGFTGGVGIADCWSGHAQDPQHWRDNYYRVQGPVVGQLQAAFMDNWMQTTGVVLDGPAYFPPLHDAGHADAQVFKSNWQEGAESMQLMVQLMLAHAQKSIRIESAYFDPESHVRAELVAAAKRGVRVQVITPGPHIDKKFVLAGSRATWGKMLAAGVEIYEYQPTMLHCKLLIVDDVWTSIGSANMDNRSFRLNDEANLNVHDAAFAVRQVELFKRDKARSRRITYDAWKHRPLLEQIFDPFEAIGNREF